ncbi:MAG: hypothetical protein JW739_08460 [Opitutales bacterium]|nr:hypothetical protein [Opitutales bacterium]
MKEFSTPPLEDNEHGFTIRRYDHMDPFLIHLPSSSNHWIYAGSNGAISAGKGNPGKSLFPYYTQDKLFDMADAAGSLCLLRGIDKNGQNYLLEAFKKGAVTEQTIERNLIKSSSGSALTFEEIHRERGLIIQCTWSSSENYGLLHSLTVKNTGKSPLECDILFGIHNIMPAGLTDQFQNEFSNLADAYKRCELIGPNNLALYYLNSVPTDRAEPSEGLRCNTVWNCGWNDATVLINSKQIEQFRQGKTVEAIPESRGLRGAYLLSKRIHLEGGSSSRCILAAELGLSAAEVVNLQHKLRSLPNAIAELDKEAKDTARTLKEIIAAADGLQASGDPLRNARHYSNTLYNVLRGGIFAKGYILPTEDLRKTIEHYNKDVFEKHRPWLETLPESLHLNDLLQQAEKTNDHQLIRLCREYLPLIFSRRHGDPSRPWNRFNIVLKNTDGSPKYAYEGNWRDIFQNWEALLYSYPEFIESVIYKFVNNSTADGHNPYRITKDGFDWEIFDPNSPWSNIGYWGDHQIIYLLKLLEASHKHHPSRLQNLLKKSYFSYAQVPYHIREFSEVLKNPSASIVYSDADEQAIYARIGRMGEDGKMLPTADGKVYQVTLMEKLLVALLSKLANLVPGGGIWMNTQRPEWNDANNALAGFGISVVTLGYIHRYILFLEDLVRESTPEGVFELNRRLKKWLEEQTATLEKLSCDENAVNHSEKRRKYLCELGIAASNYRLDLYAHGADEHFEPLSRSELLRYLEAARKSVSHSLLKNERGDGLFHAYNTMNLTEKGIDLSRLDVMLEGQVSILSAHLLNANKVSDLLKALRQSALYCPQRKSYLLQPDKALPSFLEKNKITTEAVEKSALLKQMLKDGYTCIVEKDSDGNVRFNGDFRNSEGVGTALEQMKRTAYKALIEEEQKDLQQLFEETFQHRTFTGRSSAFFAFEGLGSIYWHMVSKLILAIQENHTQIRKEDPAGENCSTVAAAYTETLLGLGLYKSPHEYGAFPTDPYSHTPKHAGAQQPGMTGQVKEDLLNRYLELGLEIHDGCIRFDPYLLQKQEFAEGESCFHYYSTNGAWETLDLPENSLAFTYCQVPVVYHIGKDRRLCLHFKDGHKVEKMETTLNQEEAKHLFSRSEKLHYLYVQFPETIFH